MPISCCNASGPGVLHMLEFEQNVGVVVVFALDTAGIEPDDPR